MKHFRRRSFALIALALPACVLEMADPEQELSDAPYDDESADVELTTAAIKNGIEVGYRKGFIQVGVGGCGGVLIGERTAITAAHCVAGMMDGDTDIAQMTIYYYDPDTQTKRRISDYNEDMKAWYIPNWGCDHDPANCLDYQDDLAVIKRTSLPVWGLSGAPLDSSDFVRISDGSIFDITGMEAFGIGYVSGNKTGFGTLRKFPVSVNRADDHWFFDLEGARGLCRGDSGGPYIGKVNGFEVLAGVVSGFQSDDGVCAEPGGRQYAARTSSRVDWIKSKVGVDICTDYGPYIRCW